MRSLAQAKSLAGAVSVDVTGYSVSFNEYLKLISIKRRAEPDQDSLTEVFRLFDPHNTGQIEEQHFRKILSSKEGITEEDIEEMVGGTTILITMRTKKGPLSVWSQCFPSRC